MKQKSQKKKIATLGWGLTDINSKGAKPQISTLFQSIEDYLASPRGRVLQICDKTLDIK